MKKILIIIMLLLSCNLISCYKHIYVPIENNTTSNNKELIYMRDSIYIQDSIIVGNDTVREYHAEYKYKVITDTVTKTDSVYNEVPVEVEVIKTVIPQWCYLSIIILIIITVSSIIKYLRSNQFSFFK